MAKGGQVIHAIKWPCDREIIPDYPDGHSLITQVLKSRKPFPGMIRGRQDHRRMVREMQLMQNLKMEEEATSEGTEIASRSCERQKTNKQENPQIMNFPFRVSRVNTSFHTLVFTQWDSCPTSDVQKFEIIDLFDWSHWVYGNMLQQPWKLYRAMNVI